MSAPLALLHGFSGGPASWAEVCAGLPGGVCPALPGHAPGLLPDPSGFEASLGSVVDQLPPDRCQLVGYSLGARVALGIALRAPERVSALVLIGGNPGLQTAADRAARARWDEGWACRFESEPLAVVLQAWAALPIFASQRALPPARLAGQAAIRRQHAGPALGAAMRQLGLAAMPNYWPRLTELKMPTTLVVGAQDQKYRQLAGEMCGVAPSLRLRLVPGAGHNPILEAPQALVAVLRSCLGR